MAEGVVTWYYTEKGYGFITTLACSVGEGRVGDRVLVRATDIQTNGYKALDEGAHVSFAVERDRSGKLVARFVTPLGSEVPGYLLGAYAAVQADPPSALRAEHAAQATERWEGTDHFVFKSGRTIVLERGFRWDSEPGRDPIELDRRAAHYAIRGLVSLCEGLIRPMSFGVTRQWVNIEFGYPSGAAGPSGRPPRWNWFVTTPQSPPSVESAYVDPQVMAPVALDERSMLALVDRALDDPCTAPDGEHVAWDELRHGIPRRSGARRDRPHGDHRQLVLLVGARGRQSHARPSGEPPSRAGVA